MSGDKRRVAAQSFKTGGKHGSAVKRCTQDGNGCRTDERDVHGQQEKTINPCQMACCRTHRREHALRIVRVMDTSQANPLGLGLHIFASIAGHDQNRPDSGLPEETCATFYKALSPELHQRFEAPHPGGIPGGQNNGPEIHALIPARICTSSATMQRAISSGVSAPMAIPMGQCTRLKSASVNPSPRSDV